ncbi:efflux RND transporter periplasmic adaptor subunit [Halioxenophilus aromaticivorans]|uniref:Efflux RND transporter periplasmic adaptor subunit n=1 Tax=Halioxenophilus aromaticivorans TaxID=1306992 RepID=A0AAV3U9W0_9ALTE
MVWQAVEPAQTTSIRHFSALTRAQERTPLSFQVPGRVQAVLVDIGQPVTQAQAIARLDPKEYELLVEQSRSSLSEAQITLQDANRNVARQQSLYDRKLVAVATLDDAETLQQQAESRVDQLQAQLDRAQKQLDDTVLLAPYQGVISERDLEEGQQVSIGQKVFQLEGSGGMEVLFYVPEQLINQIVVGSSHQVVVPAATAQPIAGQISEVGNHAQDAGAFPVVMALQAPPATVKTGMSAEALLTVAISGLGSASERADTDGTSLLSIPLTAFLSEPSNRFSAYVVESDRAVKKDITIASLTDTHALVSAGLQVGDIVVSKGANQLHDQQPVVLLDSETLRYNP